MPKVTVHKTSESAAAAALMSDAPKSNNPAAVTVKDSRGRAITIQEPSIVQESRLVRMLGEASSNAAYMTAYALPAAMVTEIDGEFVVFPMNQLQLDALIDRLGREGMAAVMDHIIGKSRGGNGESEQEEIDAIKK